MRNSLFILALLLAACGGDGTGASPGVPHPPMITNLQLSPGNAMHMAGNGEVTVAVKLGFQDLGQDVLTLWIEMPNGERVEFARPSSATTGTVSAQIAMSTRTLGTFIVEAWLADKAGGSSSHLSTAFHVVNAAASEWTNRLGGLPFVLNDVVWNGTNFVAVGDDGKILTSSDGVDWVMRQSGTGVELVAVAFLGPDVVAVGYDATVLMSADGGVTWTVKHSGGPRLAAVAITPSQIVAGGMHLQTGDASIIRSIDRGQSWAMARSVPQSGHFLTDLVYANGIFVATTDAFSSQSDARVMVSSNGDVWNEIILRNRAAAPHTILHDGRQFIVGGNETVFASPDGYNWTELHTPVDRVDYLSAAWNGSRLVVAGGITWWYWWLGPPSFERPVGLSSTDGGVTWEIFNIDGYYQSNGMAWGNGRFVSVGESTPISGLGAIYTSG